MAEVSAEVRDVILRDGSTLRLHRPSAGDETALLGFLSRLSDQSLYLRFHGLPSVGPRLVAPFLEPDGIDQDALLARLVEEREERVVALASWARLRDPSVAWGFGS